MINLDGEASIVLRSRAGRRTAAQHDHRNPKPPTTRAAISVHTLSCSVAQVGERRNFKRVGEMSSSDANGNKTEERTHTTRRKNSLVYVLSGAVLISGMIISLLVYNYMLEREHRLIAAQFERDAHKVVAAIDRELDMTLQSHEAMAGLYAASEKVESHEFRAFAERIFAARPAIRATAWWPRNGAGGDRIDLVDGYFEAARPKGVTQRMAQPAASTEQALLRRACESGAPVTAWIQTEHSWFLLHVIPVYDKDASLDSVAQRRAALAGMLAGWIDLKRVFAGAERVGGHVDIDTWIYDATVPASERWCLGPDGFTRWTSLPAGLIGNGSEPVRPRVRERISVAQGQWTVLCAATPHYVGVRRTTETWGPLAAGVIISVLLSLLVLALSGRFVRMRRLATERGEQLEVAQNTINANARSLKAAREIQFHLFPATAPSIPCYRIDTETHPAAAVDGDFYDYLTFPDGSFGLVVGDACGHGLPAALLSTRVQGAIRSLSSMTRDLELILHDANRVVLADPMFVRFVTLILLRLDPRTHEVQYVNTGHPAGYVLDPDGEIRHPLESTSKPLGLDETTKFCGGAPITLEADDMVLLMTDGVLEAMPPRPSNGHFGIERTLQVARLHRADSPTHIIGAIHQAIADYCNGPPRWDDITTAVIQRVE